MKIYLAHALTSAPESFHLEMTHLRDEMEKIRYVEVLRFNWKEGVGPNEMLNTYEHDLNQVAAADILIAIANYPSTGLGMELERRLRLGTPLYIFYRKGHRIARIVSDAIKSYEDVQSVFISEYEDISEIVKTVQTWISWQIPARNLITD